VIPSARHSGSPWRTSTLVERWQHQARDDPEAFWADAADQLHWFRRWDRVFDWSPPNFPFRWFVDGQTNLSYNCLDRHVQRGWGDHPALIAENERGGREMLTYAELLDDVKRAAAALRGMGLERGDRIAIYMPTCTEAIVPCSPPRASARSTWSYSPGFGSGALGERIPPRARRPGSVPI
jgi:acetyl-CoA synthetase